MTPQILLGSILFAAPVLADGYKFDLPPLLDSIELFYERVRLEG